MSELTEVAIDGLAAYRLTRVVVADTITEPVRQWLYRRWPPPGWLLDPDETPTIGGAHYGVWGHDGVWALVFWNKERRRPWDVALDGIRPDGLRRQWYSAKGTKVGEGLRCYYCVSVWASILVTLVRRPRLIRHPARLATRTLAVAGATVVAIEYLEKRPAHGS